MLVKATLVKFSRLQKKNEIHESRKELWGKDRIGGRGKEIEERMWTLVEVHYMCVCEIIKQ